MELSKKLSIAYVLYPEATFSDNVTNGITHQALIWEKELVNNGHEVVRVSPWGIYDWKSFDIIHLFGVGLWIYEFIESASSFGNRIVYSPIIDSVTPIWKYNLFTYIGSRRLRLFSKNFAIRVAKDKIGLFLSRSNYETDYLRRGYGIEKEKIKLVRLTYRFDRYDPSIKKEPFCLFVGRVSNDKKNIPRLIQAARKYNFHLILIGPYGSENNKKLLLDEIGDATNIELKGFVSDEELLVYYTKAKVFALPSLNEGVGLVVLESAMCGANIVITNIGGPKEYYSDELVSKVDPFDVDAIGQAIVKELNDNESQPALREYILKHHHPDLSYKKLEEAYYELVERGENSTND